MPVRDASFEALIVTTLLLARAPGGLGSFNHGMEGLQWLKLRDRQQAWQRVVGPAFICMSGPEPVTWLQTHQQSRPLDNR